MGHWLTVLMLCIASCGCLSVPALLCQLEGMFYILTKVGKGFFLLSLKELY